MVGQIGQVRVPVAGRGVDQVTDRIEDGQLHIRMDPVNHAQAAVGQVEQNRVLVRNPRRTHHSSRASIEMKPTPGEHETMQADPPWSTGPGSGEIGVCHVPGSFGAARPLHTWVLVRPHPIVRPARQHTSEVIAAAVLGFEQENVGPIVEEFCSWPGIGPVSLPHTARKQMEPAALMDQTCIEHCAIAGGGVGGDDRFGAETLGHEPCALGWCHSGHAGRMRPSGGGFGVCAVMIGRPR